MMSRDRAAVEHLAVAVLRSDCIPDAVLFIVAALAEAEQRGYERGRQDFQFSPSGDNHHNAALCPYCSPATVDTAGHRGPD